MLIVFASVFVALAILIAPFLLLTPRAPKPPQRVATSQDLDAYFAALTARQTPPALEVIVTRDGAPVYAKAFGSADSLSQAPLAPGGIYHYWSVTKLFTATAIMQLVEDGRLGLDDPLTQYLPEFRTSTRSGAPAAVTVRQLLNHSSGMKNLTPTDLVGWIHRRNDPAVSQRALVGTRMQSYQLLARVPGALSAYSNAGYIVLSAVIEAASGQPYEEFVRERILKPLSMSCTDFVYRDAMLARAVSGTHPLFHFYTPLLLLIHHDWFSGWVSAVSRSRMWLAPLYTDYTGPTGLLGSAADLARFGEAFLAGGQLDGRRILKAESVALMLNDGYGANSGPDGNRLGLGWHWWSDAPVPFKGHGGEGPGFAAQLAIFPAQRMVVVILANDTLIDRIGLTRLIAGVFH